MRDDGAAPAAVVGMASLLCSSILYRMDIPREVFSAAEANLANWVRAVGEINARAAISRHSEDLRVFLGEREADLVLNDLDAMISKSFRTT